MIAERRAEYQETMAAFLGNTKFGVDLDGTTHDTAVPVCQRYNEIYNWNPPFVPADIGGWDALRDHAISQGVPEDEADYINSTLWFDPHILNQGEPVAWTLPLMGKLQTYCAAPPQFISSRLPLMIPHTARWLQRTMPWVNPKKQLHIRENGDISGTDFKVRMTNDLGLTHFIDDAIFHAEALLAHTNAHVILMPYGKTECDLVHPRLTVIHSNGHQSLATLYKMIANGSIPAGSF